MNREVGASGNVFAVMFSKEYRNTLKVSKLAVGQGFKFVNCELVRELDGIPLLSTCQPCLPDEVNWADYFETPLPTTVSITGIVVVCLNSCMPHYSSGLHVPHF